MVARVCGCLCERPAQGSIQVCLGDTAAVRGSGGSVAVVVRLCKSSLTSKHGCLYMPCLLRDACAACHAVAVLLQTLQKPLLDQVPSLKVVMEHITTADAAEFVAAAPANIAASVTPQHMLLNRNALFAVSASHSSRGECGTVMRL